MHIHENDCNNVLFLAYHIYNIRMRTGVHFLTKEGNFLLRNEFFEVQQTSMSFSMGSFEFCYFFCVPLACLKIKLCFCFNCETNLLLLTKWKRDLLFLHRCYVKLSTSFHSNVKLHK